ncbi:MAG: hypothetical protein ABI723_11405, partial [Bacteroidia bacterium]
DIYNTFIETGMGKSFDLASHTKTSAKFDHPVIYDKYSDFYYKVLWQDDSLKFREFRLEGKDTTHKRTETINYIVGSGQHTNSHIFNTNGYLHQAPMTFYTQRGQWDLPPGFENGMNTRFNRNIGLECMTCHNGFPQMVEGSENKYSFVANGIDCERCHGPGEAHVKQKQQGVIVDTTKYVDYSIVNPAKLSINLQFDICQRCHVQGNAVLNKGKSFFDFRPGMQLSEVMNVFMPVYKGQEREHIMASHAERLKQSKCFLATSEKIAGNPELAKTLKPFKNALTCVTCHNPHVSVRVTGKDIFNNACKNCHGNAHQTSCTENPVALSKAGNDCVSCHMRKSGAIDIPHVRVTDHYISKPFDAQKINEVKSFLGIACINNPNVDDGTKGRAYINYFEKFAFAKFALDSAKKYFKDDDADDVKNNFDELVHISFLREDYKQIAEYVNAVPDILNQLTKKSYSNEDAWTCYRIGEAYYNLSKPDQALPFYERAVALAPYALDFQNKYGTLLTDLQQNEKAKTVFQFITSQDPKYPQGWCNLGYVTLITRHDTIEARKCYDNALALNPDYEQAVLNQAGLFAYKNEFDKARNVLIKYMKRNPKSEKAKNIYERLSRTD